MLTRGTARPNPLIRFAHLAWRALWSPERAVRSVLRRLRQTAAHVVPPPSWSEWDRDASNRVEHIKFEQPSGRPSTPLVSVIVPFHNQIPATLACLASISEHDDGRGSRASFEVIAVDDASTDPRASLMARVDGLQVLRSEQQRGFVDSCNWGASEARGDLLLFLNNDTLVTDRWIEALVRTFDDFPEAGIVGAKLVYPDGRLQEAGGIVWRDGSAWNYGRGGAADDPGANYARDVDYCSGACLMIPAEVFRELGGFDPLYRPAYYEDTDLAFRARERGLRVIYQPACRIVHAEGATAGRQTARGVKRHQVDNRYRFYRRWKATLRQHRRNGHQPELEKERTISHRILVVGRRVASRGRLDDEVAGLCALTRGLVAPAVKVTLVTEELESAPEDSLRLRSLGVEVLCKPFVASLQKYLARHGGQYDRVVFETPELEGQYLSIGGR